MDRDGGTPGIGAEVAEIEAEADPALDGVAENEHDGVDVDEAAAEMDGDDLVHQDGYCCEDHKGACSGDEAEGDEHSDVDRAAHDGSGYQG